MWRLPRERDILVIRRSAAIFAGLIVIAIAALILALASGSADISFADTLAALGGNATVKTPAFFSSSRRDQLGAQRWAVSARIRQRSGVDFAAR